MAFNILSIDGGGIRGILPGVLLTSLEQKLRQRSGNPDTRLADHFDLLAGTSTGAILAAAYLCPDRNGRPRFTARQAVSLYLEHGSKIFDRGLMQRLTTADGYLDERYDAEALELVLKNAFGEIRISELLKPTCLLAYDVSRRQPVIFKQHHAGNDPDKEFLVRDALRGSSAAPTFFEAAQIKAISGKSFTLIDGGMIANDPAFCAYSEALKFPGITGIADLCILSVDTGARLQHYSYTQIKDHGLIGWAKPAIDIALEAGPQMTSYHLTKIASTVSNDVYHRMQSQLYFAEPDLDNASVDNLQKLESAGNENVRQYNERLNVITDLLLSVNHDQE